MHSMPPNSQFKKTKVTIMQGIFLIHLYTFLIFMFLIYKSSSDR